MKCYGQSGNELLKVLLLCPLNIDLGLHFVSGQDFSFLSSSSSLDLLL